MAVPVPESVEIKFFHQRETKKSEEEMVKQSTWRSAPLSLGGDHGSDESSSLNERVGGPRKEKTSSKERKKGGSVRSKKKKNKKTKSSWCQIPWRRLKKAAGLPQRRGVLTKK